MALRIALSWGLERALVGILGPGSSSSGGNPNVQKLPAPNDGGQISINAGFGSGTHFGGEAFTLAVFAVTVIAAWLPARRE